MEGHEIKLKRKTTKFSWDPRQMYPIDYNNQQTSHKKQFYTFQLPIEQPKFERLQNQKHDKSTCS